MDTTLPDGFSTSTVKRYLRNCAGPTANGWLENSALHHHDINRCMIKLKLAKTNIVYNLYFDKGVSHPTAKAVGFQLSVIPFIIRIGKLITLYYIAILYDGI